MSEMLNHLPTHAPLSTPPPSPLPLSPPLFLPPLLLPPSPPLNNINKLKQNNRKQGPTSLGLQDEEGVVLEEAVSVHSHTDSWFAVHAFKTSFMVI